MWHLILFPCSVSGIIFYVCAFSLKLTAWAAVLIITLIKHCYFTNPASKEHIIKCWNAHHCKPSWVSNFTKTIYHLLLRGLNVK